MSVGEQIRVLFYFVLGVLAVVGSVMLILAPLKLYAIHRELKWQSEEMRTQTRLLATMANAADPPAARAAAAE